MNITQLLDNADLMVAAHQYENALATYNAIIKEKNNCDEAFLLRGELYGKLGQLDKAFSDVLKAISIDSDYDESYMVLASLCLAQNNPDEAIIAYKKAVALNNKDAVNQLAQLAKKLADQQLSTHQPDKAVKNYKLAMKYAPNDINLQYKHAFTVSRMGEFEATINLIENILKNDPEHIATKCLLVSVYEKTGQQRKGWEQIKALVRTHPDNAHINIIFGKYALLNGEQLDAINRLKYALQKTRLKIDDQLSINMLLGKLYDSISVYSDAFAHFSKANSFKFNDYDVTTFENQISSFIDCFSKEKYNKLVSSNNQSKTPIFILGMPRSGTSLVEQIISSHSQVYGGGELQLIPEIVGSMERSGAGMGDPQLLSDLDSKTLALYAEKLLINIQSLSPDSLRVTDKLPHNFLFIGLIHKLLPSAKIINCLRNPVDTCLSCYFQHFGGYHPYAYDLTDLGKYYLQYTRLMRHWQNELNIPILNVQYESLVKNTKIEVERVLNHLELSWEESCMDHSMQKRSINTASYTQINQKIYTNAVNRWRNYEQYISELTNILLF